MSNSTYNCHLGKFGRCLASDIGIVNNIDALDGGVDLVQGKHEMDGVSGC